MTEHNKQTRRDFLSLTTSSMAVLGSGAAVISFIASLAPSAEVRALSQIEVNVAEIEPGQAITVKWQGLPVFIRRRTAKEIAEAEAVDLSTLRDPQSDAERTLENHQEWLVMLGVCTHLGCPPKGQTPTEVKGDYNGWYCPCHGSHYDISGRIRKGPAPTNLEVPKYEFVNDTLIKIG